MKYINDEDIVEYITFVCPYKSCGKENIEYDRYGIADCYTCIFCGKNIKVKKT